MGNYFWELARKRRTVRRYTGEPVNGEIIDKMIKAALTAPSSWGGHPVEYIVVKNKEMICKIAACKAMGAAPLMQVDAAVVVIVDTSGRELWIEDGSVASAYLLLAAEEYGVGACWIHIRNRAGRNGTADEEIRSLLGVPERYSVLDIIALGVKGEHKPAYTEEDLPLRNIHKERYRPQ